MVVGISNNPDFRVKSKVLPSGGMNKDVSATTTNKETRISSKDIALYSTATAAIALAGFAIAGHKGIGPLKKMFAKKVAAKAEGVAVKSKLPSLSLDKDVLLVKLHDTEFVKPSTIPADIPKKLDFSAGRILLTKNDDGKVLRKYIATPDGKSLMSVIDYNIDTGKPKKIIKYSGGMPRNILDFDASGKEIKRTVYWSGTDKLEGIVTKGADCKELVVKFKENGCDIDYVHNLSVDLGECGSVKF